MAQKVLTNTYSDLSGEEGAERYRFSVQGNAYDVDLTKDEAADLFRLLDPFVKAGRKVSGAGSGKQPPSRLARSKNPGVYNRVKDWGRRNGWDVADRGRPSRALVDAYREATGETI